MIRKLIVLLHSDWSRTTWFQMKCPLAHLKSIKTCCIFKKREEGTNRNWKKKKLAKKRIKMKSKEHYFKEKLMSLERKFVMFRKLWCVWFGVCKLYDGSRQNKTVFLMSTRKMHEKEKIMKWNVTWKLMKKFCLFYKRNKNKLHELFQIS